MRKQIVRSRKARYGRMAVILTVLLITAVILLNVLLTTLAKRYAWYINMNPQTDFSVSENCYTLLGSILERNDEKVQIIFCNTDAGLREDSRSQYVYSTARSIADRFPDRIGLECHNIWLNPDSVRQYTETFDPSTGENVQTKLQSTSVIIASDEYYRVYNIAEFFVFEGGDTSKLWAYNGEKKLAAGILHAIEPDSPVVCMTNNHGEVFYDYELLYLLDDAGYSLRYIDLLKDEIPENCTLIVSFNPNSDLTVADGVSSTSEIDTLNRFLAVPGHSFLIFLENGTPSLTNYEIFLADWGVESCYYTGAVNTYRYMVQDTTQSLTSDGYTIYASPAKQGRAAELIGGLARGTVFRDATALRAANGYVNNGDGSYTKDGRTMYSLLQTGSGAVSWANGKAVSNDEAILFALTEQTNPGAASSYVAVCASVDYATEDFLQSAVHGNTDTLLHMFGIFGKTHTPQGLSIKPFESTSIGTVTTAQMLRWTVLLAAVPAVVITVAAVLILIRRRRA